MRKDLWAKYDLHIEFTAPVAGGLPTDPRLIEAWQRARWNASRLEPSDPQSVEEAVARTQALLPEGDSLAGWTTFARDPDKQLCIESRQIKAALKESANVLGALSGVKTSYPRARLAERVFVEPLLIPIQPGRTDADDTLERPIHVMTRQGPRDAIKRTDLVCPPAWLDCQLVVLADGLFGYDELCALLDHMGRNGLGADRSQGMGICKAILEPAQ